MENMNIQFRFPEKYKTFASILIVIGALGILLGFLTSPEQTWANILLNAYYYVALSVMGTVLVAINYAAGARWFTPVRRISEAISSYLPVASLLMIIVLFGVHSLYHWSHESAVAQDALLQGKAPYLNFNAFALRMVAVLAVWGIFAYFIRKTSYQQDQSEPFLARKKCTVLSAIFLILFAYTFSMASFDWIMSLEPHWFSTIFAVYGFAGAFVNVLVVVTLIAIFLKEKGFAKYLTNDHFHDLGKLIFAFSFFWAYIWYSQFILIWYSNIPEETTYYILRLKNDWDWLFFTNLVVNFAVPFFVLLPRASKRNTAVLKRVCFVLLVGHWLDLYLLIVPGLLNLNVSISWLEVSMALGYAGLFILTVGYALEKASLLPYRSPFLKESLHYHQ